MDLSAYPDLAVLVSEGVAELLDVSSAPNYLVLALESSDGRYHIGFSRSGFPVDEVPVAEVDKLVPPQGKTLGEHLDAVLSQSSAFTLKVLIGQFCMMYDLLKLGGCAQLSIQVKPAGQLAGVGFCIWRP